MTEVWEQAFTDNELMWGHDPARSAQIAAGWCADRGHASVLIPGIGYGRNAKPFVELGLRVRGIEISKTAIEFAQSKLGLDLPIHHGSVTEMPFDDDTYDAVFCHGLIYLLDAAERAKFVRDCAAQLAPGGELMFTLLAKSAPMYGQGEKLADDWYRPRPGMTLYFYDEQSARDQFDDFDEVETTLVEEPGGRVPIPFWLVRCRSTSRQRSRGLRQHAP